MPPPPLLLLLFPEPLLSWHFGHESRGWSFFTGASKLDSVGPTV
jgi:hypothetical protein